ncbi:MAG: IS200/IS605 family transposase [Candidatus Sericytochromatia bacterium]|nr:IS200/IS605 family transposase [Candidatus Tanganyikabacteria bacterium]
MRTKMSFFRASDKAQYAHNFHLIVTTRGRRKLLAPVVESLIEHFREVDNYGLDKIRGVAVADDQVHILVAIPPNRSVAQVAQRLKGHSSMRVLRDHPDLAAKLGGRGLWQRGYGCKNLGSASIADLQAYIQKQRGPGELVDYA